MQITFRKLLQEEYHITRALWEDIFVEDTKAFLDYYYETKTADNEIYGAFARNRLCAMLQLNPYHIRLGGKTVPANYIIAVATDRKYRKQGIMGRLLTMAMEDMEERKEPFTFLMPAAETIYYPYDFRYVYSQKHGKLCGSKSKELVWVCKAEEKDCVMLAEFAEQELQKRFCTYAVRDESYYETLLKELKSENGGILMAGRGVDMTGYVLYAGEEEIEIREPIFKDGCGKDLKEVVYTLTKDVKTKVKCIGFGEDEKPVIMARLLHLETFFESVELSEDMDCRIRVTDWYLDNNHKVFRLSGIAGECVKMEAANSQEYDGEVSVGALTSFLFGYKNWDDIIQEERLELPKETITELMKMKVLSPVFLNEIV